MLKYYFTQLYIKLIYTQLVDVLSLLYEEHYYMYKWQKCIINNRELSTSLFEEGPKVKLSFVIHSFYSIW